LCFLIKLGQVQSCAHNLSNGRNSCRVNEGYLYPLGILWLFTGSETVAVKFFQNKMCEAISDALLFFIVGRAPVAAAGSGRTSFVTFTKATWVALIHLCCKSSPTAAVACGLSTPIPHAGARRI
jgi:hypothetical protein